MRACRKAFAGVAAGLICVISRDWPAMLDRAVLYLSGVVLFFAWFIEQPITMAISP